MFTEIVWNGKKLLIIWSDHILNLPSPLVTVLMPVYNGEKYLREAIESILNQTFSDFEFLILDDGSTDNSLDIIQSYKDSRIRVVQNDENLRLIATLNKGIQLAQGEYIARMDCDDISLPKRLERQVEFMNLNPDVGICGSWVKTIGEKKGYLWNFPTSFSEIKTKLLFRCTFAHPSIMIRKSMFTKHNLYYDSNYLHAEDFELWQRSCEYFSLRNIPEVLLKYRILSSSISHSNSEIQSMTLRRIHEKTILRLGLNIDVETLSYQSGSNISQVKNIYDNLIALWEQNKVKKFAPDDILEEVIFDRWFTVCYYSTKIGLNTWRLFWEFKLNNSPKLDVKLKYKFLMKSLLRI
jgi:glycosyltransferase involved in cell wall biosynthesis